MADTLFSKLSLFRHTELDEESRWMKSLKFMEILGQGSYGVVLKANDTADSSMSAVKFIFPEYSSDQDQDTEDTKLKKKKQLSREFDSVVDKRHENVISTLRFAIRSFSHTDIEGIFKGMVLTDKLAGFVATYTNKAKRLSGIECICIQMELCGNNLRSWLDLNKDKTVDLPLAEFQLGVIRGLIEGLTYLHKYKIVHRDFKPENIYFSQGYLLPIKIGDFGLSRELHNENSKSALTSNVGTLDYMGPETHTKDYSLQADLYSLGLVIWEVVQLISSRERKGLFDKLVNDKEESLVKEHPLLRNCRELIVNLTKRDISERTQSITDVRLRVKYIALNTKELRDRLNIANQGDIIELVVTDYEDQSPMPSGWTSLMKFTDFLGAGAFSVVLKGSDRNGVPSAVKIMFPEYSTDLQVQSKEKERVFREFKNVVDKRHTNVVETIKFAETSLSPEEIEKIFGDLKLQDRIRIEDQVAKYDFKARRLGGLDSIWIQMELCGHNLRWWLNNTYANPSSKVLANLQLGIVKGLIEGQKFLHENRILHRDFKPENIYFSVDDALPIKIGDFGLSRELHNENSKSALTSNVGTLDYMAPETHTKDYSLQADLYSLGLVIWEVLQLISKRDRRRLFDRLLIDKEESLIREHPLVGNCRELIVHLTKRKIDERAKSIADVKLRVKYVALNAKELRDRLNAASEGDIIELVEAEYEGPFSVRPKNIALRGKGVGTVFVNGEPGTESNRKEILYIYGEDCVVTNIKIISGPHDFGIVVQGSECNIHNIHFEAGYAALSVKSSDNKLSNLLINNVQYGILLWKGFGRNKLNNIVIQDVTQTGIQMEGSDEDNEIDSVTCQNVKRGVEVDGNYNKLSNISCQNTKDIEDSCGVLIFNGTENSLDNIKCSGFSKESLYLDKSSSRSVIRDSICDGVTICGSDHTLGNVEGGIFMVMEGCGHRLENCKAEKCNDFGSSVTLVGCHVTPGRKLQLN